MKAQNYKKAIAATITNAPKEKVNHLKRTLKALREADPTQEDFIQSLVEYSCMFSKIGADVCDWIISDINAYLDRLETVRPAAASAL